MHTRRQGFSLVELLIALTLGLVVVAGIVQLFGGNSRATALVTAQARLQENARYAFGLIGRSVRSAGFFGCGYRPEALRWGLNGAPDQLSEVNVTRPVEGFEARPQGRWSPPLSQLPGGSQSQLMASAGAIDVQGVAPGTDSLVVRQLQSPGYPFAEPFMPGGDPVILVPSGATDIAVGEVVMAADCGRADVFRVTAIQAAGAQVTLRRAPGPGLFDNAAVAAAPAEPFANGGLLGRVVSTYFYIAPSLHLDNRGGNPLALWQKAGGARPEELIQGVEDLQVQYAVDATDDGVANPNQYLSFDRIQDPTAIVAVRVTLTVNSVDAVGDARLARTFSETIMLRNARSEA